jgi:hypothetical protein
MTVPGTAAALKAAVDEYGQAAYELGCVLRRPIKEPWSKYCDDAARAALNLAITTYVEAEVARRVSGAPTTARSERRPVAGWVVRMSGRDLEFQTSNGVSFYARVHGRTDSSNPTGMDAWWRVGIDGRPLLSGRSETSTLAQFAAEDALFALSDGIRRGTGGIP